MDYQAKYQEWLNNPALCEEGKAELTALMGNEKELEYVSNRISNAKIHNHTRDAIYRIFVLLSESDLDFNTIVNYVLIYY